MIFSLSIDLDPLYCYGMIYGLDIDPNADPITPLAAERFMDLCQELNARGTIFVVGRTLDEPRVAELIKTAGAAGHEIANHSFSHPYDLSRLARDQITKETEEASRAIEKITGLCPKGFRAPGYLLGKNIIGVLEELGFAYDSSILPSAPYQGLKAMCRLALEIAGRKSRSLPAAFSESLAPSRPYRPDVKNPQRRGGARLLEIPLGTLGGLPLLGGLLALAGERLAAILGAIASRKAFLHLQLHGADLVDIESDRLPRSLGVQPDYKIPWRKKARAIAAFCRNFASTHRTMTLRQVAATFSG